MEKQRVSFWADGCASAMACGHTPEKLIAALAGLPISSHHGAKLSVETLGEAIANSAGG